MSTALAFESKAPHTTPWLLVEHAEGDPPYQLFAALAQLGWTENEKADLPPFDGIQEVYLEAPKGSALFGGWEEAEARKHMPAVRRLLRKHGFDRVPWNRLELADLI
jgi:hypothetical protein